MTSFFLCSLVRYLTSFCQSKCDKLNCRGFIIYRYLVYQSVCRTVGIGYAHPLPPHASVSPLRPKGVESKFLLGDGGPNSDDWIENLALCCTVYSVVGKVRYLRTVQLSRVSGVPDSQLEIKSVGKPSTETFHRWLASTSYLHTYPALHFIYSECMWTGTSLFFWGVCYIWSSFQFWFWFLHRAGSSELSETGSNKMIEEQPSTHLDHFSTKHNQYLG
jgi:hypothetical protein